MKTLIICFSQTGNTRKIAEKIRDGIAENTDYCDIVDMEKADVSSFKDYDLIGLGCPVFYFKEPFNVRDFLEGLPRLENNHWFVFCSHAAVIGRTLLSMTECLEEKGALVIGSHHSYADLTVPFYPKHTLTSGHPDDHDLLEAFDFGKAITKCSKSVSKGDTSCIAKPSPFSEDWVRDEANMLTHEFLAQVMPRLSINSETCIQCGECHDSCPVNGIDIECDPPRIQAPCIYCFHCASICPTCSIEADWSQLVEMAPNNYARYTNALNDAKDRGEFRWLVDPETVDCGNPLHKQREREIKGE
ncbi:MAG: 4Fe-4S ferredoxin [Planctomycetes bacterium]|nr:4Fe-4S ferredoxin [Planctomycetota bacterium]